MNRKRTNRLILIFNIIILINYLLMAFSFSFLSKTMLTTSVGSRSLSNNFIVDFLVNYSDPIFIVAFLIVAVLNIISAIQNKKDTKISFWQSIFAVLCLLPPLKFLIEFLNVDILDILYTILFGVLPIILAIINIISINKNKPRLVQVISYILVIIVSILYLLDIIPEYPWYIIAIVMQTIYVQRQVKTIKESNSRAIVNIILYYVIQSIVVVGLFILIISALLISQINNAKLESAVSILYDNFKKLDDNTNSELYIPVEKDNKYGFINENGEEKIACQYDKVSYFNEIPVNNTNYYLALAKKDNSYYIISKSNKYLPINGDLEKYITSFDNNFASETVESFNTNGDYNNASLEAFNTAFQILTYNPSATGNSPSYTKQTLNPAEDNYVPITYEGSTYTYKNDNYTMIITPLSDQLDYADNYSSVSDMYANLKYSVVVKKSNKETESIVNLPGFSGSTLKIKTFSNGYIGYESEDGLTVGWYDNNGNQTSISSDYIINDIKNNFVILQSINTEQSGSNYIIMDFSGHILLQSQAIDIYQNTILTKNSNNKMVLLDNNLNTISNEYDKIITNSKIDISPDFSSYIN